MTKKQKKHLTRIITAAVLLAVVWLLLPLEGVWQLLAYCAGVGGSMLIIGSAAGVVVMGLERISFGWYMRRISWIAFVGYIAGIMAYALIRTFIMPVAL